MDGEGATRTAKGNSQVIRKSLTEGALGDMEQVRISRRPGGPFEPLRHFREYRDPATVWAARREAGPSPLVPLVAEPEPVPSSVFPIPNTIVDKSPAVLTGRSGPTAEESKGSESPESASGPEEHSLVEGWKVAILVLTTVVVVGAICLLLIP